MSFLVKFCKRICTYILRITTIIPEELNIPSVRMVSAHILDLKHANEGEDSLVDGKTRQDLIIVGESREPGSISGTRQVPAAELLHVGIECDITSRRGYCRLEKFARSRASQKPPLPALLSSRVMYTFRQGYVAYVPGFCCLLMEDIQNCITLLRWRKA